MMHWALDVTLMRDAITVYADDIVDERTAKLDNGLTLTLPSRV